MSEPNGTLDEAVAMLAAGLSGAIGVSGFDHLPRPTFTSTPTGATASATPPVTQTAAPATAPPAPTPPVALTALTAEAPPTAAPTPALNPAAPSPPQAPPPQQTMTEDVGDAIAAAVSAPVAAAARLQILQSDVIGDCVRCKLHRGRNTLVFGVGDPNADLVFVGEGPGEDEDRSGVPFVGRAGQLLTKMIAAMGRDRDRGVYICNVVKCRPPNNRKPEHDEVDACLGFLDAQLAILRPKVIVGLGGTACQTLLQTTTPISKLRGRWTTYRDVAFMPTYHPSYLLREERDPDKKRKREAWEDLKLVMQRLGAP